MKKKYFGYKNRMLNLFKRKKLESEELQKEIQREIIRQARWRFNFSLGVATISMLVTISGISLLYAGKIGEVALTTSSSIVASFGSFQLAKAQDEELRKILKD
jgi:hypothetical protein